jgi:hypothetical protein
MALAFVVAMSGFSAVFWYGVQQQSNKDRRMTHGEPYGILTNHDRLGRFTRGNNARDAKLIRIAAKAEELRREYFPCGGETVMDANRLQLAARHYIVAETHRDPVVAQRSTRLAEYLLSKIKRVEEPLPSLSEMGL